MMRNVEEFFGQQKARTSAHSASALVSAVILLLGIVASSIFAKALADQNSNEYTTRLNQQSNAVSTYITDAVDKGYGRLLLSASALYAVKGDISESEWRQFYDSNRVPEHYPAIVGFGFVEVISADNLDQYTEQVRNSGHPNFTLTPNTPRDEYTAIRYLEPQNEMNVKAYGFDMFSEANRRIAMANARDHAIVAMSAPVDLLQDEDQKNPPLGVLMYYPIYKTGTIPQTISERREQLKGYAYIATRPNEILQYYIDRAPELKIDTNVILADTTNGKTTQLFRADNSEIDLDKQQKSKRSFSLNNRHWTITVAGRNSSLNRFVGPSAVLALGSLASATIAFAVFAALLVRLEGVEQSYGREVQKTKDELLALTSHQLRTPASGVKQYLGMLVQGFVGTLTDRQFEIAQKAYDANERQLEIINELLYVSKADAGQLFIEPTEVNLTKMTQDVTDGFEERAKQKNIQLVFNSLTPRHVMLDSRFGAMIIENLISNAIKYSHAGSKIQLRLKDRGNSVVLSVADNGVGIPEEDLPKIFQKFQRIENELSHSEGGSGLGLFLAMQLANAHGGDIEVESKLGVGSVFSLILPKTTAFKKTSVSLKTQNTNTSKKKTK